MAWNLEVLTGIEPIPDVGIAFTGDTLKPEWVVICFGADRSSPATWRRTMYHLSDQGRMNFQGRSLPTRSGAILMVLAYGALAIIAGVVFGTLSVHPF
jgi:hypothetical protein